jgi:hypothetical protein
VRFDLTADEEGMRHCHLARETTRAPVRNTRALQRLLQVHALPKQINQRHPSSIRLRNKLIY